MRRRHARHAGTCDDCGGPIERGAPVDWQPPLPGSRRAGRATHPVCPGTEDLRGLSPLGDLVLAVADDVELRGAHPDRPVPYRVSVPLHAAGGTYRA
jgi:hypothetical protein